MEKDISTIIASNEAALDEECKKFEEQIETIKLIKESIIKEEDTEVKKRR